MRTDDRRFPRRQPPIDNAAAIKELESRIRQIDAKESWRKMAQLDHAAREAGQETSPVELLALSKAIRDSGEWPPDTGFFYVVAALMQIADDLDVDPEEDDPALKAIGEKLRAAEVAHGLAEDEYWPLGEAPDDVEQLRAEWEAAHDRRTAAVFRAHGEGDMADLFLNDRLAFDRRYERGRRAILGPLPADMEDSLRKRGIID